MRRPQAAHQRPGPTPLVASLRARFAREAGPEPTPFHGSPGPVSRWLPVVLWAALISLLSTDSFAGARTDEILRPLIRWVAPAASDETIALVHAAVRKLAHFGEYAVLGALVLRALAGGARPEARAVVWSAAACAAYAVLDELHQTWVPSRTGAVLDVAIDAAGAVAGVALRAWAGAIGDRRSSA
jgi:VanZ family protein